VVVDPSLRDPDGPEAPTNVAPVTIALDKQVNLIGRRSEKRAILPEVSLDVDDAVSHRHALLTVGDDGSLTLRDIGSSNGTRLNSADVHPLVDTVLHDGDQITLGRWTRLTVKAE
jgi:pSer/pThr/pTyr-binding forkhead associated (FHA) protein